MNENCPICHKRFQHGEQIHRRELHESEVPHDISEPDSWSNTSGPWIHDDCEPWPKVTP